MTLRDFEGGSLYGLEKFWAFHHYTGFPRDQPGLEMLPKVRVGRGGEGGEGGEAARARPAPCPRLRRARGRGAGH